MKQTRIEDIVLIYLMEANLGRIFYIGLATGHLSDCIILDVALQLLALGWANIGAAVAPDAALASLPAWFTGGMTVGGGMVVAVGYAMVINLMATKEVWPFFFLGFALAPLKELTLIATGIIGLVIAIVYLNLSDNNKGGGSGNSSSGDPLGDILNNY